MTDGFFVYERDSARARVYFNAEQRGHCAVCGKRTGDLVLDHEHSDLSLCRGLICQDCNLGLGWFRDNIDALRSAADYLTRHGTRNDVYRDSADWQERRVKVKVRRLECRDVERRNQKILAAITRGDPARAVADRFGLSVSQVNRIVDEGCSDGQAA